MGKESLETFIEYWKELKGDEKGEAQVFCDRLFQAFEHKGYKEAGAVLESRVQGKKSTKFADLLWPGRVVIEMKKRGAKLESHRAQVFNYWWNLRPNQPQYSILCNFDELYIYDFSVQDEPVDKIRIENLPHRATALNFLYPTPKKPLFENNLEAVTREAASYVAHVFNSLINRGEDRKHAQRFILQSIFTMFAEDFNLLPEGFFTSLLKECYEDQNLSTYDLIGGLFRQMASPHRAKGGRYRDIDYFNGGLFEQISPIELNHQELHYMLFAAKKEWSKVNPSIFGAIFQGSLGKEDRHAYGAHFTSEIDIYKIVHPCIIEPWLKKIDKAKSLSDLKALLHEIRNFKVLDPACGSGNFLYIAYRELKRLEMEILNRIHTEFPAGAKQVGTGSLVSLKQFYGIDLNSFAVELARVTLLLAKEIALRETQNWLKNAQLGFDAMMEKALPLDNLDDNIIIADALFTDWPVVDVIIGNPPYQSKNKMQDEYGPEYVAKVRNAFIEVPGRADFCVYWYYKAHLAMKDGSRAGLVGTNTIRQNYSREGSLDYIVNNGGTIFNAVSSQNWSGDAVVFVSIVNWIKGPFDGPKLLFVENDKGEEIEHQLSTINSSLSIEIDVADAQVLNINKQAKSVYQGQTHGHAGFLLSSKKALELIKKDQAYTEVVHPFLIARELVGNYKAQPERFVIDFSNIGYFKASSYKIPFDIISNSVLPWVEQKAKEEREGKTKSNGRENQLKTWWEMWRKRSDLLQNLSYKARFIACARVSKRAIFDFVSTDIRPNDALMVFTFEDDYSFGIIQSVYHWEWWKAKCSTLKGDYRYTTNTVWDTFPFPQSPTIDQIRDVSSAAVRLRSERTKIMEQYKYSLRDLYRLAEQPGANPIKSLHQQLDTAVCAAYGFDPSVDILQQLLDLNLDVSTREQAGESVTAPGLPSYVAEPSEFITDDCIRYEGFK